TSSPDHAAFGYKVKADRYLSKPLDEAEVLSLIERAAKHFEELSDEIFVTVDRRRRGIRLRDIRYVEARNKQSVIHLQDEAIVSYIKIDELEKLLRLPSFLRCHRSFIANMDYVENIGRDFEMQGGGTVYIGHISQWKVRKAYRDYIERLAREGRQ
ncbi:MAG: LytTR family transcriptional regulator DNA-binding domain-containing protein, partial [Oscillospiraceae bacterium]|nr:LytTR family transcriptional regulator DNA-binding domain-containing protein [Oscillospiraceae bacterium]